MIAIVSVYATAAVFALLRLFTAGMEPNLPAEQKERAEKLRPTFRRMAATAHLILFVCAGILFWKASA